MEYTGDREPVSTGGWDKEASFLAHIFTAIRTQSLHRKTRSERSGNNTNAVMTAQTPSPLWGKDFQLPQNCSNTAGACRGTHLRQSRQSKPHGWMFADLAVHKAFTCSFPSHIVFSASSHISSCTLCLLSFLTLKFSQLLCILWLPVITNKQNILHDWFFLCECGLVSSKNRKNSHGCFRAHMLEGWTGMWST